MSPPSKEVKRRSYLKNRTPEYLADRREYSRQYRELHKDVADFLDKNRNLKLKSALAKRYGLTVDQYEMILEVQDNKCAICRVEFNKLVTESKALRPHVDHNHTTNKVRGMLCHHCNLLLGYARENIDVLEDAIKYLERHK